MFKILRKSLLIIPWEPLEYIKWVELKKTTLLRSILCVDTGWILKTLSGVWFQKKFDLKLQVKVAKSLGLNINDNDDANEQTCISIFFSLFVSSFNLKLKHLSCSLFSICLSVTIYSLCYFLLHF